MSTAIARRQPNRPEPVGELATLIQDNAPRIAAALPKHLTPERFAQVFSILVYRTPKLRECDRESLITAIIQGSTLGLDFNPAAGEAYLIPRWNWKTKSLECQFQPGYQGLEKLARNTGDIIFIHPREVYERDTFRVRYDPDLTFTHEPTLSGDRGRITHVYAEVKFRSGDRLIEIMTAEELESIHQRCEGYLYAQKEDKAEQGPWVTDRLEMMKKTVIKRLCKRLPRTPELIAAIAADDAQYIAGEEIPPPPPQNDSGFGRGQYASPEQTAAYTEALNTWLGARIAEWADAWTDHATGECRLDGRGLPKNLLEPLNAWQANGHLLKWAVQTGRLDSAIVPEESKTRQAAPYVAIVYHRSSEDHKALVREMNRYAREQFERAREAIYRKHPELKPEDEFGPDEADPDTGPGTDAERFADDAWPEGRM